MKYRVESFCCDYAIYDNKDNIIHVFNSRIYADTCCNAMNEDYYSNKYVEGHYDPKGPEGELPNTPITPKHYKRGIETWDYIDSWGMDFLEGSIIKYVTRWRDKNGIEDLKKANQFLLRLIEREEKKNEI